MNGRAWALLGLAIVAVALRNAPLFLLALLLALVAGAAWLWLRVCLFGVRYTRRLERSRLFPGDEIRLAVELTNAKPLPLAWLRAEDEVPRALAIEPAHLAHSHLPGRRRLVNLVALRWYERVTRHYRVRADQRGAWSLGPAQLYSGDLFGFASREREEPALDTLLVYPRLVPLSALGLPAARPFGEFHALRRLAEDPLRFSGAREYAVGDSMRQVHWKATARRGSLQTKTFDPSANRPLALFLNIDTHEHGWEGYDPDLQEFAVTVAASLARWAWEQGQPVGLFANGVTQPGARRVCVRPASHRDQLTLILEALARLIPFGRWPLAESLRHESLRLPYGTTVVVVTALLPPALCHTLLSLRGRGIGVVLVTLGPACAAPPLAGIQHCPVGGHAEWEGLQGLKLAPA
ncbi:MAG: DUF58 domain-containing protein [Caldilinea sp.]